MKGVTPMNGFKIGLIAALATSMAATAANASEFAVLGDAPAAPLSASEMKSVEGKAHVYLLVESKGVELNAKAEAATRAAAPTPMGGDFARTPSREATAFDFLN